MAYDEKDNSNIIETYLRSKAAEFSQVCQGLTYMTLTYFSITSFRKRKFVRYLSSYEGKFTLIAIIAIAFSLTTGISTIGFLKDSTPETPCLTIIAHSGVWDTIPARQESSKDFLISNTNDKPIKLELKVIHWNPFISQDMVKIDWDYDGTIIPPNQSITVKITATNLDYQNPNNIILDIIVHGFEI
ncbi:MAG: hypothetical protein ACXABF_14920 [Candidatus Thorarchaeota archaeon]|jgi:hypothetical protein